MTPRSAAWTPPVVKMESMPARLAPRTSWCIESPTATTRDFSMPIVAKAAKAWSRGFARALSRERERERETARDLSIVRECLVSMRETRSLLSVYKSKREKEEEKNKEETRVRVLFPAPKSTRNFEAPCRRWPRAVCRRRPPCRRSGPCSARRRRRAWARARLPPAAQFALDVEVSAVDSVSRSRFQVSNLDVSDGVLEKATGHARIAFALSCIPTPFASLQPLSKTNENRKSPPCAGAHRRGARGRGWRRS